MARDEEGRPPGRHFIKSPIFRDYSHWKEKLRENCCKRVHEQRANLLWKLRLSETKDNESSTNKDVINLTFQEIVDDEFKKIKIFEDANKNTKEALTCTSGKDDMLWEYAGLQEAYQGECEDILLEMQRIFYEELEKDETIPDNGNDGKTWEDEEDEYLAHAVYEHMQLNDDQQVENITWCPICNQGKLRENPSLISCTLCEFKLKSGNEISVDFLREQLAEAHADHLGKGCKIKPKFCIQTKYGFSALYMECEACTTFEVVV
ncbi:uncharacterized protein LOC124931987 isoform X2 [Impatiens glandulifera]|uniref:uncharacterized protein LOC124931987 isoform X2 n=1 Tax=Impatiens glandulifera TaxID=253017 RepID=UPI001FB10AA3|nr:uncharacterized protein LOC124931987 isoform X2 [Impatiens glandulifera]